MQALYVTPCPAWRFHLDDLHNDKYEVLATSESELFLREIDVELTIVRDEKGQVQRILSVQGQSGNRRMDSECFRRHR